MIVLRSTNMQCPLYKVTCDVCLSPEATAVAQKCRENPIFTVSITKHEKSSLSCTYDYKHF